MKPVCDANPRFAPSTIAQWLALLTAGLAGWINTASHEHVTLRRHHDLVTVRKCSPGPASSGLIDT